MTSRVFLLSPANCGGRRAKQLLAAGSRSPLSARLHSAAGAPVGDVFAFVSGLYFRGKLTYARRFAVPPEPGHPLAGAGIHVITPDAGLRPPEHGLTAADLTRLGRDLISADNPGFTQPLARSSRLLLHEIGPACDVILLGSIASPKYVDVLLEVFGSQLLFPVSFVGRGDMSRGGLLLRQAAAGTELEYAPVLGATRKGKRPPKLEPLPPGGHSDARR